MDQPFYYHPAKGKLRGVLSVPHSGELLLNEARHLLTDKSHVLSCDVDYRVFDLIKLSELQQNGISIFVAKYHRYLVDLNRPRQKAFLNWKHTTKGDAIVIDWPQENFQEQVLSALYDPYYHALIAELKKSPLPFLDLHSMPSEATEFHLKKNPHQEKQRPEFCISNQGSYLTLEAPTASQEVMESLQKSLHSKNRLATLNDPYRGGHLMEAMASYATSSVQIEIRRNLYMDEAQVQLVESKIKPLSQDLTDVLLAYFIKS